MTGLGCVHPSELARYKSHPSFIPLGSVDLPAPLPTHSTQASGPAQTGSQPSETPCTREYLNHLLEQHTSLQIGTNAAIAAMASTATFLATSLVVLGGMFLIEKYWGRHG